MDTLLRKVTEARDRYRSSKNDPALAKAYKAAKRAVALCRLGRTPSEKQSPAHTHTAPAPSDDSAGKHSLVSEPAKVEAPASTALSQDGKSGEVKKTKLSKSAQRKHRKRKAKLRAQMPAEKRQAIEEARKKSVLGQKKYREEKKSKRSVDRKALMKLRKRSNTQRKFNLSKQHEVQGRKLFIGGLAWRTNDASLLGAFAKYGAIDSTVCRVKGDPTKSRGFGFVVLDASGGDEMMAKAVAEMDGVELDGKKVGVKRAEAEEFHNKKKKEPVARTRELVITDEGDGPSEESCRAFKMGKCSYGDSCRFTHEGEGGCTETAGPHDNSCRAFIAGNCSYGDDCRFTHEASGAAAVPPPKSTNQTRTTVSDDETQEMEEVKEEATETFSCENECGFTGGYDACAEHEKSCAATVEASKPEANPDISTQHTEEKEEVKEEEAKPDARSLRKVYKRALKAFRVDKSDKKLKKAKNAAKRAWQEASECSTGGLRPG